MAPSREFPAVVDGLITHAPHVVERWHARSIVTANWRRLRNPCDSRGHMKVVAMGAKNRRYYFFDDLAAHAMSWTPVLAESALPALDDRPARFATAH